MINQLLRMKPRTKENYIEELKRICKKVGIETATLAMHSEMDKDPARYDAFLEKLEEKGMLSGISWKIGIAVYDDMKHAKRMEEVWRANQQTAIQEVIKKSMPSYFEWRRSKSPMITIAQFLYGAHRTGYNAWGYNLAAPPPYTDTNMVNRANTLLNMSASPEQITLRISGGSIATYSDRSTLVGAGLVGSGANPAGCMAGNGTYGAVNFNDYELGMLITTGTGYSGFQIALTSDSAGGITPTVAAVFSATYTPTWIFTCNVGGTIPTAGATYTNNGVTFTVRAAFVKSSNWILITTGGAWTASGSTLTKTNGTGDTTITFSASQGAANTTTYTIKNAVASLSYCYLAPSAQVNLPAATGSPTGYQALYKTAGTGDTILLYSSHTIIYQLYYQDDLSLGGISAAGSSGSGTASWSFQRLFQNLSAGNVTVSEAGISAHVAAYSNTSEFLWVHDAAPTSFTAVTLQNPQVLMVVYQNTLAL